MFLFALSFYTFIFYYYSLNAYLFLYETERKQIGGEIREELGEVEWEETIPRIYCMKKIDFQLEKNKSQKKRKKMKRKDKIKN